MRYKEVAEKMEDAHKEKKGAIDKVKIYEGAKTPIGENVNGAGRASE